jgi:hypothetical protein
LSSRRMFSNKFLHKSLDSILVTSRLNCSIFDITILRDTRYRPIIQVVPTKISELYFSFLGNVLYFPVDP